MVEMINKNEAKLELSMIVQPSSRLFLVGWLLILGLKECLVECATGCVKSVVILTGQVRWEYVQTSKMPKFLSHSPCQLTGWKSGSNGHYSRFGVFLSKIQNLKFRFFPFFLLIEFSQIKQKMKMGHVQDSPVSTNVISNEYQMKVHIVRYNLGRKKFKIQNLYFAYLWTNGFPNGYSVAPWACI